MLSNPIEVEVIVCLLWAAFALISISPAALLFTGRPKRARQANIGPSRDEVASVLAHLWTPHPAKPPPSREQPLATA